MVLMDLRATLSYLDSAGLMIQCSVLSSASGSCLYDHGLNMCLPLGSTFLIPSDVQFLGFFWAMPAVAQGLLLSLCSVITPNRLRGPY